MKVEVKNELGFECLSYVEEGVNIEDAVNILLKRYFDSKTLEKETTE